MLNFFKKYLNKNNNLETEEKNTIVFTVTKQGDVFVEYILLDNSNSGAIYLSNLLFELNGGQFTSNLVNLLLKLSKDNKSYDEFVKKTIASWSILIGDHANKTDESSNEKPIIAPSKFYNGNSR